ncbi:hypothetical protein [Gluconacetobacter diazotrophicus]|uniref:hypothetical protein n=1 Tax=Gluconacetobacter diazotrophicus TaxID=33996 RepID=UPI00059D5C7F|nr:hypothetical protein [Gluconacetobacter diazotrophicus]
MNGTRRTTCTYPAARKRAGANTGPRAIRRHASAVPPASPASPPATDSTTVIQRARASSATS